MIASVNGVRRSISSEIMRPCSLRPLGKQLGKSFALYKNGLSLENYETIIGIAPRHITLTFIPKVPLNRNVSRGLIGIARR